MTLNHLLKKQKIKLLKTLSMTKVDLVEKISTFVERKCISNVKTKKMTHFLLKKTLLFCLSFVAMLSTNDFTAQAPCPNGTITLTDWAHQAANTPGQMIYGTYPGPGSSGWDSPYDESGQFTTTSCSGQQTTVGLNFTGSPAGSTDGIAGLDYHIQQQTLSAVSTFKLTFSAPVVISNLLIFDIDKASGYTDKLVFSAKNGATNVPVTLNGNSFVTVNSTAQSVVSNPNTDQGQVYVSTSQPITELSFNFTNAGGTGAGTQQIWIYRNFSFCCPLTPIEAVNDNQTISAGSTGTTSVLNNDTFDGGQATTSNVNLYQLSTSNSGVTLNTTTGNINVASGTPAGTYTVTYKIVEPGKNNYSTATATITVPMPEITARPDNQTISKGSTGTTSVLNNDTFDGGSSLTTSNVSLSQVSTSHTGVTLNTTTGNVSVTTGTPSGTYEVTYKIKDPVNTTNTSTAIATITVPVNLPVELLYFSAKENQDKVDLVWATASERNNDYFVVERSKDGIEWEEVVKVQGAGNSTTTLNYFDVDKSPLRGRSYYRLTQYDFDGKSSKSNIESVNIESKKDFSIFPNPTSQENIQLRLEGFKYDQLTISLQDLSGRTYLAQSLNGASNSETIPLSIDSKLSSGVYIVTVRTNNQTYTKRLVLQ